MVALLRWPAVSAARILKERPPLSVVGMAVKPADDGEDPVWRRYESKAAPKMVFASKVFLIVC